MRGKLRHLPLYETKDVACLYSLGLFIPQGETDASSLVSHSTLSYNAAIFNLVCGTYINTTKEVQS